MYRHRLLALAIAAAVYGVASACSESLPEGRACPALCPNQAVQIHDTTIDGLSALAVDTTIAGYPLLGTAAEELVAASGDSIDIRTVIRFDSISYLYRPSASDTLQPAARVLDAYLRLTFDTNSFRPRPQTGKAPVIGIYDVDTTGSDTSVAVLASLFRPDRLLATQPVSLPVSGQVDTLRIPLDSAKVLAHVVGDHNIRVGIRMVRTGVAPPAGRVAILNFQSGLPPVFSYEPDTDTTVAPAFSPQVPRSTTPTTDSALAQQLLDYPVIVSGTSPPLGQHLDIGGMPARRIFVQFALPTRIIDSSTVVRATLTLHLIPTTLRGFFLSPPDSMGVLSEGIVSTPAVTDPGHAAGFNAAATVIGIDTSYYVPGSSDSINIEFVNAARHWKDRATDTVSRAIVLIGTNEGATTLTSSFYPALPTVPAPLRPHIHLAYVKTIELGAP